MPLVHSRAEQPPSLGVVAARFRLPALILLAAITYGTLGYVIVEGWTFFESLYMTVITLSSVGFGEVKPLSQQGRLFTITLILMGLTALAATVGVLAEVLFSGELGQTLRRRRMLRSIHELSDHYVICAFGRVGRTVAEEFLSQGAPCVAIESQPALIPTIEEYGVPYIIGDPTHEDILREAGVERAKGLVCAVDDDAVNVFIALTARSINPRLFIVARASNVLSVDKLVKAGADRVVSPYDLSARRMASLVLRPSVVDFVDMVTVAPELRLEEMIVGAGSALEGQTVAQALHGQTGVIILALKKVGGDLIPSPEKETVLERGDLVVALGAASSLNEVSSSCEAAS